MPAADAGAPLRCVRAGHWIWGGGWLATLGDCAMTDEGELEDAACVSRGGAIDFAGGIVIHTTAGVASLIVAIVLGPRTGFDPSNTSWNTEARPHSIPLAVIGAAMLWMGWFGFNAGSALASGAGEFPAAPPAHWQRARPLTDS